MITRQEIILKDFFTIRQFLEIEILKYINEIVCSKTLYFHKVPRNYTEILEILNNFLKGNSFRWVDLTFYALDPPDKCSTHPHAKIGIFLFGKSKIILENIKEISGRIVSGNWWMNKKQEIGISPQKEFNLEHFI